MAGANHSTQVGTKSGENLPRLAVLGSILAVFAINFLDVVVPPLGIPAVLLFLLLFFWLTGQKWTSLGLMRPRSWARTISLGVGLAVLLEAFALLVLVPLMLWFGVEPPDITRFEAIRGNLPMLLLFLTVSWTTAGFGEEVIWRGFLMTRLAWLLGSSGAAWTVSLILVSMLFGLVHAYQGAMGMVMTGFAGLVYGFVFLVTGRNLWLVIVAHGMTDTLSFLALYFGLLEFLSRSAGT